MPRYAKPKHKTMPKPFLAVMSRPAQLRRERPEENIGFQTEEGAISAAQAFLRKWADDQPQAEVFRIDPRAGRVKVWPVPPPQTKKAPRPKPRR